MVALTAGIDFLLDLAWFWLGHWRGPKLIACFAALRRGVERVTPRLHQYRRKAIFMVRFLYGLRTAGPLARGMVQPTVRPFTLFNALGAIIWAGLFASLGYLSGRVIAVFLSDLVHDEQLTAVVIDVLGLCELLWHFRRSCVRGPAP